MPEPEAETRQGRRRPATDGGSCVQLNVGGVAYATTRATLERVEGSTLAELCETGRGSPGRRVADSPIFLDRDGPSFRWILNYLRAPPGVESGIPGAAHERQQLAVEADFFVLTVRPP